MNAARRWGTHQDYVQAYGENYQSYGRCLPASSSHYTNNLWYLMATMDRMAEADRMDMIRRASGDAALMKARGW